MFHKNGKGESLGIVTPPAQVKLPAQPVVVKADVKDEKAKTPVKEV